MSLKHECMGVCPCMSLHDSSLLIAESLKFFLSLGLHIGLSKIEVCLEMGVFNREFGVILAFLCPCMARFLLGLA